MIIISITADLRKEYSTGSAATSASRLSPQSSGRNRRMISRATPDDGPGKSQTVPLGLEILFLQKNAG